MPKKRIEDMNNSKLNKIIDKRTETEIKRSKTIEETKEKLASSINWWSWLSRNWKTFSSQEIIQDSNRLIKEYWLTPLWNRTDFTYLSRVISISDFQADPEKYFLKLSEWFGSFPLDFDLDWTMKEFFWEHMAIGIHKWKLHFQQRAVFNNKLLADKISKALRDLWVNQSITEWYIDIDFLSFLKNYDAFVDICENEFDTHSKNKTKLNQEKQDALNKLKLMKHICISIFNTVTSIKVVDPKDFFGTRSLDESEAFELQKRELKKIDALNPFTPNNENEQEIFWWLEQLLLQTAIWTSQEDINKLVPIQNFEEFHQLIDFLIWRLKTDKKLKKSWISKINKEIEEFTSQEIIALAAYIARYLIEDYENLDDWVERVLKWFSCDNVSGKCTDYTWMTLQVLKNYFMIEYPEKFKNIYVWYDDQNIWDRYKHCYMKIYAYDEDWSIKTTFLDPTKLANHMMEEISLTEDIIESMESWNLPIQVDRNAEDLIISKLRKDLDEKQILESDEQGIFETDEKRTLESDSREKLEDMNTDSIFKVMVKKIKEKFLK